MTTRTSVLIALAIATPAAAEWCHTGCGDNHDFGTYSPSTNWTTHAANFGAGGCRWYRFNLALGNAYTFSTCQGGGIASGDSRLTLYDSLCQFIGDSDDSVNCSPTWLSNLEFTPAGSGHYYLRVDQPASQGMSYALAYKRTPVLDPPQPEIVAIDFPSESDLGEWLEVDVTVRNTGGPAYHAGISLSVPNFTDPQDGARAEDAGSDPGTPGYAEFPAFSTIWHRDGYPFPASYLLVEWQDLDWPPGAVRILRVRLRPKTTGPLLVQVRSAMTTDDEEWINVPTSGAIDQQGWFVIQNVITVVLPCPADIDGNSEVGFTDLVLLLGNWGPCPDCSADINADGAVDFDDLIVLLGDWGECG